MSFLSTITEKKINTSKVTIASPTFRKNFAHKDARVIAEIKPGTPLSKEIQKPENILANIDKSTLDIGGYSILIDREYFGGSVENINLVKDRGLPILYKEFIVSTKQIDEAIRYGYSAVLLIYRIIPSIDAFDTLVQYTIEHHIEPLIEVDNEEDLIMIMEKYSPNDILIGINSRDLSTLEMQPNLHMDIYSRHHDQLVDFIVFALSGVSSLDEIDQYTGKYNGILIGSMFRKEDRKLRDIIINQEGHFGEFGGRYLPELLIPIIDAVRDGFFTMKDNPEFLRDLHALYADYVGRPSPLVYCPNITKQYGGAQLYLKNEGLNHTGAHKINHCVGQILLAKYLGKTRIIAETGAGQHGLATASVCARMGFECIIYMGRKDYDRQRPNVYYMELAGATVVPVDDGEATLRSAINAAMKDLINHSDNSYYLLGTACGPHPYPSMNVFFQKIIGEEVRKQSLRQAGKKPDILVSCVGGGSNSLGLFYDFLDDASIRMIGVEAGGKGTHTGEHAARFVDKTIGMTQGFRSYFLQTEGGNIRETYSISAGLDYSGVSPQTAYLESIARIEMASATDEEALHALQVCMKMEGLLPALESAHGIAHTLKLLPTLPPNTIVVCNMSGRGEKDLFITAPKLDPKWTDFLQMMSGNGVQPPSIKQDGDVNTSDQTKPGRGMSTNTNTQSVGVSMVHAKKKLPLMTHLVAGYPDMGASRAIFDTLSQYSEYIEIQIPFSDPTADGPVITRANEIARQQHIVTDDVFEFISTIDTVSTHVLIMTYYQILLTYGVERFIARCKSLGIYGIIIPDIPYDEADGHDLITLCRSYGIHTIATLSPSTPPERLESIRSFTTGFIYAISSNMTTGTQGMFGDDFEAYIAGLRGYFDIPIGIGFGVKTRADLERVSSIGDFGIIGTELIRRYESGGIVELQSYMESLV